MIGFISSLFTRGEPAMSEASARDASAIAILHGESFRRGWSEQEVEGLLLDRHVKHCVAGAFASGDEEEMATKTAELLAAVQRFAKTR